MIRARFVYAATLAALAAGTASAQTPAAPGADTTAHGPQARPTHIVSTTRNSALPLIMRA